MCGDLNPPLIRVCRSMATPSAARHLCRRLALPPFASFTAVANTLRPLIRSRSGGGVAPPSIACVHCFRGGSAHWHGVRRSLLPSPTHVSVDQSGANARLYSTRCSSHGPATDRHPLCPALLTRLKTRACASTGCTQCMRRPQTLLLLLPASLHTRSFVPLLT
jgi:hypothetical protein